MLARGGREWADLIEAAYKLGAVFESWNDNFALSVWLQVAQERGLDLLAEAHREWPAEAALPWDHISCGVEKEFLLRELRQAEARETTADCRWGDCSACGMSGLATQCAEQGAH